MTCAPTAFQRRRRRGCGRFCPQVPLYGVPGGRRAGDIWGVALMVIPGIVFGFGLLLSPSLQRRGTGLYQDHSFLLLFCFLIVWETKVSCFVNGGTGFETSSVGFQHLCLSPKGWPALQEQRVYFHWTHRLSRHKACVLCALAHSVLTATS